MQGEIAMLRQVIVIGILSLAAALGAGCSENEMDTSPGTMQDAHLIIRSSQGQILATGNIALPDPLPASGSFSGNANLTIIGRELPPGAIAKDGEYQGEVREEKEILINLNPGVMDNNINLVGTREGSRVTGNCEVSTFAGPRPIGTFELRLKAAATTPSPAPAP